MGSAASPAQLKTLTDALDTYCAKSGITQAAEREALAAYVFQLYQRGLSDPTSLAHALSRIQPPAKWAA